MTTDAPLITTEQRPTPGEHGHLTTADRDACPVCNPSSKQCYEGRGGVSGKHCNFYPKCVCGDRDALRPPSNALCDEIRNIARDAPMSAGTRTRLHAIAHDIEKALAPKPTPVETTDRIDWKARAEAAEGILNHNMALANATTRKVMEERNAIIRKLRERYSAIEIAEQVGLTRQRVHQILNEAPITPEEPTCALKNGGSRCTCGCCTEKAGGERCNHLILTQWCQLPKGHDSDHEWVAEKASGDVERSMIKAFQQSPRRVPDETLDRSKPEKDATPPEIVHGSDGDTAIEAK
jgi:hypothetical protein